MTAPGFLLFLKVSHSRSFESYWRMTPDFNSPIDFNSSIGVNTTMSAHCLNHEFSLTDSNLEHKLFCHKYIIFIAKWVVAVYVSFDYVYSMSNENWKHCGLFFSDIYLMWKSGAKKNEVLSKQETKLLWFICIARKYIRSAPFTPDLKKKPYVPNFG